MGLWQWFTPDNLLIYIKRKDYPYTWSWDQRDSENKKEKKRGNAKQPNYFVCTGLVTSSHLLPTPDFLLSFPSFPFQNQEPATFVTSLLPLSNRSRILLTLWALGERQPKVLQEGGSAAEGKRGRTGMLQLVVDSATINPPLSPPPRPCVTAYFRGESQTPGWERPAPRSNMYSVKK